MPKIRLNPLGRPWDMTETGGGSGGGDVNGPGLSTNNAIVRWDGVAGTDIQNSVSILDDNGNLATNAVILGYTTTATSAGTTTLTVDSTQQQFFTGATTQTVVLPVVSTLRLSQQYRIVNNSTGIVTVQSSGANTIQAMATLTELIVTCISLSGTGTASWAWTYRNQIVSTAINAFSYALSDEITALTTGVKLTCRAPYACTLLNIRGSLTTASSSGALSIDMLVGGSSILSTKLTIDQSETTSLTAVQPVISTPAIADDDEIEFEILSAGTNATGAKVTIYLVEV